MKTQERLKMSPYHWLEIKKTVEHWIEKYGVCQWPKPPPRKEVAPLGKYEAGEPMKRITIEVIGPL